MIICPWKDIKKYAPLLPGIEEAFDAVNALTEYENGKTYPLSDGNRFFVTVVQLNQRMIFDGETPKREDYATVQLPYRIQKGPIDAYDELMSTSTHRRNARNSNGALAH